jgi:hypothetical protein
MLRFLPLLGVLALFTIGACTASTDSSPSASDASANDTNAPSTDDDATADFDAAPEDAPADTSPRRVDAQADAGCGTPPDGGCVNATGNWTFTGTCGVITGCSIYVETSVCYQVLGCTGAGSSVSVRGNTLDFTYPGSTMHCSATVCGNTMTGSCHQDSCTFTAHKQ